MTRLLAIGLAALVALSACNEKKTAEIPKPHALNAEAIGHYCGMNVLEHPGPKGQIILESRIDPVWFSSARDTIAFTRLAEEPKDVLAVYVSDMGKAKSWDEPGAENWVDARKAWYVVGGSARSGMGVQETVPFAERAAADRFAAGKGGRVLAFAEVPAEAVLAGATPAE